MKCIFLLFLVLPNVLCFIIPIQREKRQIADELIVLTDGRHCSDLDDFVTTNEPIMKVKDVYSGWTTLHPVVCPRNVYCHDGRGSVNEYYRCKPDLTTVCFESSCNDYLKVYEECNCKNHYGLPSGIDEKELKRRYNP